MLLLVWFKCVLLCSVNFHTAGREGGGLFILLWLHRNALKKQEFKYFVNRTCLSSISSVHFRLYFSIVGVDVCLGQ